jgi:hypothetical protein
VDPWLHGLRFSGSITNDVIRALKCARRLEMKRTRRTFFVLRTSARFFAPPSKDICGDEVKHLLSTLTSVQALRMTPVCRAELRS